jgi:hypothetical protein
VLLKATEVPLGLFAFGQMRRLNGLAGVESVFSVTIGSDVTTGGLGLLKNLVGGESGQNSVLVSWTETSIPRLTPGTSDLSLPIAAEQCDF